MVLPFFPRWHTLPQNSRKMTDILRAVRFIVFEILFQKHIMRLLLSTKRCATKGSTSLVLPANGKLIKLPPNKLNYNKTHWLLNVTLLRPLGRMNYPIWVRFIWISLQWCSHISNSDNLTSINSYLKNYSQKKVSWGVSIPRDKQRITGDKICRNRPDHALSNGYSQLAALNDNCYASLVQRWCPYNCSCYFHRLKRYGFSFYRKL